MRQHFKFLFLILYIKKWEYRKESMMLLEANPYPRPPDPSVQNGLFILFYQSGHPQIPPPLTTASYQCLHLLLIILEMQGMYVCGHVIF